MNHFKVLCCGGEGFLFNLRQENEIYYKNQKINVYVEKFITYKN